MGDGVLEQTATARALSRDAVLALSAAGREPAWMRERRLEAWHLYEATPMPSPLAEEWRRTDITGLDLEGLQPYAFPSGDARRDGWLPALAGPSGAEERGGLLMQRDSGTTHHDLDRTLAAQGVIFTDLGTALRDHADLVREHFMTVVRPDELKFRALHAALWSGGTFLYVPPEVEVTLPLVAATRLETPGLGLFPHTLVIADERSQVTLIDLFGSDDMERRTVVAGAAELIARPGARLRYVALQEWGRNVWEFGIIRAHLERDVVLNSMVAAFGGSLVKTDVESLLRGQGAHSEMLGVYFGDENQHYDFHTLQAHEAPNTLSDLLYKGAVKGHARSVFAGLIRVLPGAQKTNAFQSNRNLILNEGAKSDSIPKLEIMANDLRCTHGSATSRLHEEHLFYLMSRGLTRRQAIQMVVDGFFSDVVDRIPLPILTDAIRGRIAEKMEGL